jgi:hypothetical protein
MIEITCPSCGTEVLGVVVLGRHLPAGDGTLTYLCNHSARVVSVRLSFEHVMAAVFAGAKAIDVESVR